MTNNVIDFAAYRASKTTNEAPAKVLHNEDNVIALDTWKAICSKRKSAAIVSTTDVLMSGGYAA